MSVNKWNKSIEQTLAKCEKSPGTAFFPTVIEITSSSGIIYIPSTEEFTINIQHKTGKKIQSHVPKFVNILKNTPTEYKIKLPLDYRAHLVFLLTQWAKTKSEKSLNFDESFTTQYEGWCKRFGGAEPIPLREQKGIIGEVFTLLNLYDKYGYDAIESWSRDALIDFNMNSSNALLVEVKSSSDKTDAKVSISEYNQLENFNGKPKSILSVVRIKSSVEKGVFIHKYLQDSITEMKKKIGRDKAKKPHLILFEKKIKQLCDEDIFDKESQTKFFTKHEIISIAYYEIEKDDSADKMAKQSILPAGVDVSKYKLDPTVLKPLKFP